MMIIMTGEHYIDIVFDSVIASKSDTELVRWSMLKLDLRKS